jgi:hypothetical protein
MVDNVIAVHASGCGLQVRRAVHMRDAQLVKVAGNGRGFLKPEIRVELHTICRDGDPLHSQVRGYRMNIVSPPSGDAVRLKR